MHETNTFSIQKTDMALWRRRDFHRDNEIPAAFRGTRSALGASFEAADKFGWTLIHPVSANANPSGTVTDDAFEQIGGLILAAAEHQAPIDGVLLHLHGAMVVDSYEDGEGELLARLRQKLGPEVPVVVTLDLHANVTQQMADNASALIAFRTYPHIDQYERAWQGAELLERAMQGEVQPRTVIARRPMIVADYTDNPGGGGYGDATAFLKGLVEAGVERVAFHAICDPEAVMAGMRAGVGARTTIALGGKTDRKMGGGPLNLIGEVTHLTNGKFIAYGPMGGGVERDYGPSMVFRTGGIDIVCITHNGQAVDLGQFTSLGIDPTRYTTVCVKSMQHFRAAFEPIARAVILVDTGALCQPHYTPELFDKVRRPVWPLDEIAES